MFRSGLAAAALVATSLVVPATGAHADPKPNEQTIKELEAEAKRLNTQLEQLTEQYNGLRVRLGQSKRAEQTALDNSQRQSKALKSIQQRVGEHAAINYMTGGATDILSIAVSDDPQRVLDQASTLHYLAQEDDTEVRNLVRAIQSAERARKGAEGHGAEVTRLSTQVTAQKTRIETMLNKVRGKLTKYGSTKGGSTTPAVHGGSGKGLAAVKAAMTKLGKPYVWGAEGPDSFDCSGLTMWAYKQVGVNIPHYGGHQWRAGVHVDKDELEVGDIVFFYTDIHHNGMYIGNGKFVHAPQTGDVVKIEKMSTRPFAGAVRIV